MELFWKYFHFSQFQKCINLIEKSGNVSENLSLVDVSKNLNYKLCKLLLDLVRHKSEDNQKSNLSFTIQNGENAVQDIFTKVKSLPPSPEWMDMELTLLFNVLSFQLLQTKKIRSDWTVTLKKSICFLRQTFKRVKLALKMTSRVNSDPDSDDSVVELTENLVSVKHLLKVYNLLDSFCLVVCIHSLVLIYCKKVNQALLCLEVLESLAVYNTDLTKLHAKMGILIYSSDSVDDTADAEVLKLMDVVNFSLGLCYYKLNQSTLCQSVLKKINYKPWKHQAAYLIGSSLLAENVYSEALESVTAVLHEDTDCTIESQLRARLFNLQGICFSKQNFHHSAIAAFREALQADFTELIALYNVGLQYRHLGLVDEELEALNLLITILEDRANSSQTDSSQICFSLFFTDNITSESVSLLQALYALASRTKQLERFNEASEKYLDLLAVKSDLLSLSLKGNETNLIKLPDMVTIYTECAYCLLKSGQFKECIIICTKALETYTSTVMTDSMVVFSEPLEDSLFADDKNVLQENTENKSVWSRKRQRSESCVHSEDVQWKEMKQYMTLIFYKTDALYQMKDFKSAADILHSSIEKLQDSSGEILSDKDSISLTEVSAVKKQRIVDGQIINPANSNNAMSTITMMWQKLLSEACSNLANVLMEMDNLHDSLHYCRLSIQINKENTKSWYTLSLVLQKMGRHNESINSWLQHRSIHHKSDSFQLANELKRRRDEFRLVNKDNVEIKTALLADPIPSCELLKMDISSIEQLLKCQQSKYFVY